MNEADALRKEGDDCFERNEFDAAVEFYRQASLAGAIGTMDLVNLSIAEEHASLAFRRRLSALFPTSLECKLAELFRLADCRPPNAQAALTQILPQWEADATGALKIRLQRFNASLQSRDYSTLADDFYFVWRDECNFGGIEKIRFGMLKQIAAVHHVEAIEPLRQLAASPQISAAGRSFLLAKANELAALNTLILAAKTDPASRVT